MAKKTEKGKELQELKLHLKNKDLQRLEVRGCTIYRTDLSGTIHIRR